MLDNLQALAEAQGQGLELDAESIGVMFGDFDPATFLTGIGDAIGGAFGDYLSSQLVAPNGEIAAIAGQITSTVGGWLGLDVGLALGGPIGGIVGDFIGSFLGDILGTLFGDLFGDNGPPTASLTLGTQNGQLGIINMASDNGGTAGAFTPIATAVGNIVNSLIGMTGAQLTLASDVTFAQSGNQVGVTIPGVGYEALPTSGDTSAAWTKAAQDSVMAIIDEAHLSNGDPIVTTAFAAARAQDGNFEAIASDLQVAKDYETYLANTAAINQLLEQIRQRLRRRLGADPLRAEELGLTQVPNEPGWKANLVNGSASGTAVENVYENNGILVEEIDFNGGWQRADRQVLQKPDDCLSNVDPRSPGGLDLDHHGQRRQP